MVRVKASAGCLEARQLVYKEGHLGASRTRGKHMDAMWCHVKCHVRRRACEAVGRPCRACEAPWLRGLPFRLSCVEHCETLPALSMTSTVLPRVLRGPLRTFVAPVVDVNEIYGLIVVFTGKYGPAKS